MFTRPSRVLGLIEFLIRFVLKVSLDDSFSTDITVDQKQKLKSRSDMM